MEQGEPGHIRLGRKQQNPQNNQNERNRTQRALARAGVFSSFYSHPTTSPAPTPLPYLPTSSSTPPVIPALASLDFPGIASEGSIPFLDASLVKAAVTTATA